jgi:very-short-patch-repair endonuclease
MTRQWGSFLTVPMLCQFHGLPAPEAEVVFLPGRRFRADFCWRAAMVILEIDGGVFRKGASGHSSGTGIVRDIEKSNLAQLEGYVFLRCTPREVETGSVVELLKRALL